MKFNFPEDKKTDTVTISIYENDIKKVRRLAEKFKCTHQDIYRTLINEAIEEYEEKFGEIDKKEAEKKYDNRRDYLEAGDGLRKKINQEETIHESAKELGKMGGLKGGPARAEKLSSEERSKIASDAAITRWGKRKTKTAKLKGEWARTGNTSDDIILSNTDIRFCQNMTCPKPGKKFVGGTGVDWVFINEVFKFCSENCKLAFVKHMEREEYKTI